MTSNLQGSYPHPNPPHHYPPSNDFSSPIQGEEEKIAKLIALLTPSAFLKLKKELEIFLSIPHTLSPSELATMEQFQKAIAAFEAKREKKK